jgi:hypothetical protein
VPEVQPLLVGVEPGGGVGVTGAVVVNLTRGRLAVYVAGRRVWVGTQDQWSTARKVAAQFEAGAVAS